MAWLRAEVVLVTDLLVRATQTGETTRAIGLGLFRLVLAPQHLLALGMGQADQAVVLVKLVAQAADHLAAATRINLAPARAERRVLVRLATQTSLGFQLVHVTEH